MIAEAYTQILDWVNKDTFKNVAVYNQQVERMIRGSGYSFETPALFVEVNEENEEALGDGITASDLMIKFHIVMEQLDSSDGNLDQNMDIFQYRNAIKSSFSMFKLAQGGIFNWLNEDEDYDHGNIYHYILGYKCYYIDFTGQRVYSLYEKQQIVWNLIQRRWDWDMYHWDQFLYGPDLNITAQLT